MGRASFLIGVLLFGPGGCGDNGAEAGSADKKPFHHSPNIPASKRILGTWEMDINNVPEAAMTADLRQFKEQGMADKVRIEYTFTDTEFILEKMGAGGYVKRNWHYQILSEQDNKLELERVDDCGKPTKVEVLVRGTTIWIGFGRARIPLTRKWKR